jgi:hypothetical protein
MGTANKSQHLVRCNLCAAERVWVSSYKRVCAFVVSIYVKSHKITTRTICLGLVLVAVGRWAAADYVKPSIEVISISGAFLLYLIALWIVEIREKCNEND